MRACINCRLIEMCTETSLDKVLNHFVCDRWEPETQPNIAARVSAVTKFGPIAIKSLLLSEKREEDGGK